MKSIVTVLLFVLIGFEIECADQGINFNVSLSIGCPKKGHFQRAAERFEKCAKELEEQQEREKKETAARAVLAQRSSERAVRLEELKAAKKEITQKQRDVTQRLKNAQKKSGLSSIKEEGEHNEEEVWDGVYKKCAYGIIIAGSSYWLITAMTAYFSL